MASDELDGVESIVLLNSEKKERKSLMQGISFGWGVGEMLCYGITINNDVEFLVVLFTL